MGEDYSDITIVVEDPRAVQKALTAAIEEMANAVIAYVQDMFREMEKILLEIKRAIEEVKEIIAIWQRKQRWIRWRKRRWTSRSDEKLTGRLDLLPWYTSGFL